MLDRRARPDLFPRCRRFRSGGFWFRSSGGGRWCTHARRSRHTSLGKELLNILHRVVSLPSIKVSVRRGTDFVTFRVEIDVALIAADAVEQVDGDLFQEARGDGGFGLSASETAPVAGPGEEKLRLGARHADVTEAALFFHRGFGIERAAVRKKS